MRTTDYVEYMVLPRLPALSEVVWAPASARDWEGFSQRLPSHLARLQALEVNFRIPDVLGLENDRLSLNDSILVELSGVVDGGQIRYALDGSDPGPGSQRYDRPFMIPVNERGTQVSARLFLSDGRGGATRRARFGKTQLLTPVSVPIIGRAQGLGARGFAGRPRSVDGIERGERLDISELSPLATSPFPRITVPEGITSTSFGLVLNGFLRVPSKGVYTFYLSSDDGSQLSVGDRIVVPEGGAGPMAERAGQVALHRGWHPIEVRYFQSGGAYGLRLEMKGPGVSRREVPAHWLAHLKDPSE